MKSIVSGSLSCTPTGIGSGNCGPGSVSRWGATSPPGKQHRQHGTEMLPELRERWVVLHNAPCHTQAAALCFVRQGNTAPPASSLW